MKNKKNNLFLNCWVVGWAALGLLSWLFISTVPDCIASVFPHVPKNNWGKLFGIYFFTIASSTTIITLALNLVGKITNLNEQEDKNQGNLKSAILIGFCESVLYPTSIVVGKPDFIAVWLALKVAGQWKSWEKEHKLFNKFLIGNALSIMFSFLASHIIRTFLVTGN